MANPLAITVHDLAEEIAPGESDAVDLGEIAEGSGVYRSAARLALELVSIDPPATSQTGPGPSVSFTGVPTDPDDSFYLVITDTGDLDEGAFQWSKDGGQTLQGPATTIPADGIFELGSTGITATFAAGEYQAATAYTWAFRLGLALETSSNGLTGWRPVYSFDSVAEPTRFERAFVDLSRYIRAAWTIEATGATFSLDGQAHQVFFTRDDIESGEIPAAAIASIDDKVFADAIIKASDDISDHLNGAFVPPIVAVGDSVRQRGSEIAIFRLMKHKGFKPGGYDELIVKASDDAMSWLKRVASGALKPHGIVDSTPTINEASAAVVSVQRRGW